MSGFTGDKPVFFDLGGKRWPRARLLLFLFGLVVFISTVLFVQSLFVPPVLVLPLKLKKLKEQLSALQKKGPVAKDTAAANAAVVRTIYGSAAGRKHLEAFRAQFAPKPNRPPRAAGQIRLAYTVGWDPASLDSLSAHVDKLTHVCPEWFTMTSPDGTFTGENDVALLQFMAANHQLTLLPMMTNAAGEGRKPEAVENLVRGPVENQNRFIENLKRQLGEIHAGGVLIDWAGIDPASEEDLTAFLEKVANGLHDAGLQLWLQVPVGDEREAYDLETLADSVDFFVASLYDQVSGEDPPNSIAAENWYESWLDAILKASHGDTEQWVIALGNYGYDWAADPNVPDRSGWRQADTISFADAMSRAAYAGESGMESGAPEYNPSFDYTLGGVDHEVWFLDAVTFLNQARAAHKKGFNGLGINRLGTEDPQLWTAMDLVATPQLSKADLDGLSTLKTGQAITNIGEGEIVTADISPENGRRQVEADQHNILAATYEKFPRYPTLYHQGAGGDHQVVLTFDDGPDPTWTPQILDILKAKGAPAVFFLLGQQAENYPRIVRRIVAEGHEIGSHTYTHTNLALASPQRQRIELDATERLIQTITGRSTTLFRPPYEADSRPTEISEVTPLLMAQDLGYMTVMESIDPEDWDRPGTDVILQRVKQQRHNGSIILLHDAGGDRSQTVAALPKIIDYLRARGDQIVPLSQLLGTTRDALNPPLKATDHSLARLVSSVGFQALHAALGFLWAFMIVATGLIVLRTLLIVVLALQQRRGSRRPRASEAALVSEIAAIRVPVSVIIAAYNEEKVIGATLRSVLDCDYEGEVEVVVVNDGSRDGTGAVVADIAAADPRVRLFEQTNAGKSEALRHGVEQARFALLVFLDADTLFQRDTLRQLVAPFGEGNVGAVSGHARVGNVRSFIARCQALEYICGFNLDRRAYDAWNCITVAPGAISAVSREALSEVGGFRSDTLAEDTDMTLSLHRRGYRIRYAAGAIAYTEAPETIRTLAKQRFRWCFGTMQCLWKHRDMVFNPKFKALGFFSLPSVWFFQIILVALTPAIDLLLLASLFLGEGRAVLPYFLTFLLLDQCLAVLACALEKEPLSRSWIMIPMRLIYRPLLGWVVWKSIKNAARGVLVGWGKLERTASVTVPARP